MNPKLKDKLFKVLAQPDRVNMQYWTCHTTHCIAGWVLTLSGYKQQGDTFEDSAGKAMWGPDIQIIAAKLLDLDLDTAQNLFFVNNWPADLKERYRAGDTTTALEALERVLDWKR